MENITNYKEERFDSFLNKTILFTSKSYFIKQMKILNTENTIMDNEDFASFIYNFIELDTPYSSYDDIDSYLDLKSALKSLSAIEQAVVFLLYKKELTQEEASQILEIYSKSVSRIKLRAFDKLRNYLEGDIKNEE